MTPGELQERTYQFALKVAQLTRRLPAGVESAIVRPQVLRAATSVASNYRAACRARSRRDFVAKLGIVIEEVDESDFWLRLSVDLGLFAAGTVQELRAEADELMAIFTSSQKTARLALRR